MEKVHVDLSKGYWNPQRKQGWKRIFSRYVALNLEQKLRQRFSEKEGKIFLHKKIFSPQFSFEFVLTYIIQKQNHSGMKRYLTTPITAVKNNFLLDSPGRNLRHPQRIVLLNRGNRSPFLQ